YIVVEGNGSDYVGDEPGYRSFPYQSPRTFTESGDAYGYSPAMQAMPALGSVSAIKKTTLKSGQKAVDPPYLSHDSVTEGLDIRPGANNPGTVDGQGRMLVRRMETGNFQVAENMLADERKDIEDSFFVTLFQILTETPEMTATEVMERVAEKAALLAPTMGKLQTEYLGPTITREIDVLFEMGYPGLPEVPPELVEAQGEYEIVYTSPLAKGMYAEEVSGFFRLTEAATQAAQATGKPELLDFFDFETAIPEIGSRMSVPTRWMNDIKKVQALRGQREQQIQQQQIVDSAPALASVATAAMKQTGGAR
ncbi:portal protein, partial [Tepidimonas sp.]|uniref:portal protein n=1 Tax=Tepidimonas sp. TaxID=2002775 RepID=UPI00391BE876